MVQIGEIPIDRERCALGECQENPFWCPDALIAKEANYLDTSLEKEGLRLEL